MVGIWHLVWVMQIAKDVEGSTMPGKATKIIITERQQEVLRSRGRANVRKDWHNVLR